MELYNEHATTLSINAIKDCIGEIIDSKEITLINYGELHGDVGTRA